MQHIIFWNAYIIRECYSYEPTLPTDQFLFDNSSWYQAVKTSNSVVTEPLLLCYPESLVCEIGSYINLKNK